MEIFPFSSTNKTNIWADIGAGLWVVSRATDPVHRGRITKSRSMHIGSLGILYWVETQSLTTPFVVLSIPDAEAVVRDVWPEEWVLPFKIRPLGTPYRQMHKDEVMHLLPTAVESGSNNISNIINITPPAALAASRLTDQDWALLVERLADAR